VKRLIMAAVAAIGVAVTAVGLALLPTAAQGTATTNRCFHVYAPYQSYSTASSGCRSGYALVALQGHTSQVLTVTNWKQSRTYALKYTWGTQVYGISERVLLGLGMCWISALAARALTASTPEAAAGWPAHRCGPAQVP
jgi:hypothetical protein